MIVDSVNKKFDLEMPAIISFEEIKSWQKARKLNTTIYRLTNSNDQLSKDFGLKDQIRRSSVSITSNIAEGYERETTKEFIRFLYIAKGSAGELKSQIYLAYDLNYINEVEFEELIAKINEVSKLIFGFIKYLKTKL